MIVARVVGPKFTVGAYDFLQFGIAAIRRFDVLVFNVFVAIAHTRQMPLEVSAGMIRKSDLPFIA
ncbi:hypothetical protein DVW33_15150 [Enterococcus faecium]|nr:hypothetical protein DVW33_15150 [Enterococcus faecium]